MKCPACGSVKVYDNRADKAAGKRTKKYPDFKCANKDCTGGRDGSCWIGYGDEGAQACGADYRGSGPAAGPGAASRPRGPQHSWVSYWKTAERCWKMAGELAGEDHPQRAAIFATLFIGAKDANLVVRPKAPPAPPAPPPPPPPPRQPEPPIEEPEGFDDDDDLPF